MVSKAKAANCKGQKKRAPKIKDYRKIIEIQEQIIRANEQKIKFQEAAYLELFGDALKLKDLYEKQQQELELAYKDRNTAIRRYNALHQLGEMAEGMGIDLTAKLPEKEMAKWDQSSFKVDTKVLESGRTTYSIKARKKPKSQKPQDYTKQNGKGKKKHD